jgi:hypothetical protein
MHHGIAAGPAILRRPLERVVRLPARPIFGSVRAVTRLASARDPRRASRSPRAGPLRSHPAAQATSRDARARTVERGSSNVAHADPVARTPSLHASAPPPDRVLSAPRGW